MLDYLLYVSTKALLEERTAQRSSKSKNLEHEARSDQLLGMVDGALTSPPTRGQRVLNLECRLYLLKYTSLFVRRLYPSPAAPSLSCLEALRRQNRKRVAKWLRHRAELSTLDPSSLSIFTSALPLSEASLDQNRQHVLSTLAVRDETSFYGTPSSPSLLDAFPIFMALSSTVAPTASITPAWMATAGELMLQAALEQYLVYGAQGPEALTEAFAWGYDALENVDEGEQGSINAMFWDEIGEQNSVAGEVEAWTRLRGDHMRALIPDPGVNLETHLADLSVRFPLNGFEDKVLNFLQASLASQPVPILTQLEIGKLKGISRGETEALKRRVGIP
ncbi:MAG: hypothetical protein M1812_004774 [Candelaria pacifica]|nr:MAG: hypothetical protein M1812_004774 [Candelaria pacifica]